MTGSMIAEIVNDQIIEKKISTGYPFQVKLLTYHFHSYKDVASSVDKKVRWFLWFLGKTLFYFQYCEYILLLDFVTYIS